MIKKKTQDNPFKWKQFKGDIILWTVRWYCRYAVSYVDLKEMAAERGLSIERSTICRWVHEYGQELAKRAKPYLKLACGSWYLDETYLKIKGIWHYLYRAIDKEGNTLDWMLSRHRNKTAAERFFKKILGNVHVSIPYVINVDKNPSIPPAHSALQKTGNFANTKLRQVKYLKNSIENDHKFVKSKSRYRQSYQTFETARRTIDGIETMRMIQKGQVRHIRKGNIGAQNNFIQEVFGLAA